MIDIIQESREFIWEFDLIKPDSELLIGVSGGVDSMVLLDVLLKHGYKPVVAHANFGLRGQDSNEDARFVKDRCKHLGLSFYTRAFDIQEYTRVYKVSVQMAARTLRYQWFYQLADKLSLDKIAVATHLDDNIETFILNAVRGTGLKGLRGILPKNDKVVRPFLEISKADILAYAEHFNLEWREDRSNAEVKYRRNLIRHEITPSFGKINPSFHETFKRNFRRWRATQEIWDAHIEKEVKKYIEEKNGVFKISVSKIAKLKNTEIALEELFLDKGLTYSDIRDMTKALGNTESKTFSTKKWRIHLDRNDLIWGRKTRFAEPESIQITEFIGGIEEPLALAFKDSKKEEITWSTDRNTATLDFDKLTFPLLIRKWKEGDKMKPLGMNGRKRISDILIDAKVPVPEKDQTFVVLSKNEICWLIGHRISDDFKVTDKTQRSFQIIRL
ncbi:MAG TPA: tRNA lysidine(34) synthetase TilS [Flavobacteriales bacterium]|jgi:tRNA(Ile)-lysidine synthase|nr:tRNA lysidine(34) synthetase TilS [Flavobacteriales bacterium]